MKGFNLIVTTQRGNERACIRELLIAAEEVKAPIATLEKTRYPGLLVGLVDGDPLILLAKIRSTAEEDPWSFRFVQKIIPIQKNSQADIDSIKEAVSKLVEEIPQEASFKIAISKRGTGLGSADIIKGVAPAIKRKVDLERPDRVVQIEIIDETAGVSILHPDEVLSITKLQDTSMRS